MLTIRGGESVFKIVEINDFKQLPHITLAFRPGNDSVVKQVGRATASLALPTAVIAGLSAVLAAMQAFALSWLGTCQMRF